MRVRGRSNRACFPDAARISWIMSIIALPRRPRKRKRSIVCATGPICARERSCRRNPSASPIATTTCRTIPGPSASISTANSTVRSASASLTSKWRGSPSIRGVPRHAASRTGPGQDHHRSDPLCRRSRQGEAISGTALCDGAARLCRVRPFQRRYRACHRPSRAPGVLSRVFLQEPMGEPRLFPGLIKPVGLMAADYPDVAGKGVRALPVSCARAPSSGGCCSSAPASAVDAAWRRDHASSAPRSFRTAERPAPDPAR